MSLFSLVYLHTDGTAENLGVWSGETVNEAARAAAVHFDCDAGRIAIESAIFKKTETFPIAGAHA